MRDLTLDETGHVYGAGGSSCEPQPPSCGEKNGSGKKNNGSNGKKEKNGSGCYSGCNP